MPCASVSAKRTRTSVSKRKSTANSFLQLPLIALTMHENELSTDAALVRRLVAAQFPAWGDLPVEHVPSSGTVNTLYRLGDEMVVRLPRVDWGAGGVAKDSAWLPRLAPLLPVPVPVPIARGAPAEEFRWEWGIYPWLEG